tara:strand:+ start:246 stop:449 length:204 start_codon:yes stop_codon:yes gene_type:complete
MATTRKRTPKKIATVKKVTPTPKVVITKERRNLKELSLLELSLLPFLYLEEAAKLIFEYINKRYPLT